MSFWSTLGKIVGTASQVAGSVVSVIPGLQKIAPALQGVGSTLGGISSEYDTAKQQANINNAMLAQQWNLQKDAQKFNKSEALSAHQRNLASMKLQQDYESSEAEKLRSWQERMTNESNDWNSPAHQLQMLRDAGYNPNLLNSSVIGAASTPSSALPSGGLSSSPSAAIGTPSVPQMANQMLAGAQARLANAQADKLEGENRREESRLPYDIKTSNANISLLNSNVQLNEKQMIKLQSETEFIGKQMNFVDQQIQESISRQDLNDAKKWESKEYTYQMRVKLSEELRLLASQADLNIRNADEVASKIVENLASAAASNAQARLADSQVALNEDIHYLNGVEIEAIKDHRSLAVQYLWDEKEHSYQISVNNLQSSKDFRDFDKSHNWRYQSWTNPIKYLNFIREQTSLTGTAVGTVFGANFNVSNATSTSKK